MTTVVPVHGTKGFLRVNAVDLSGYLESTNMALARDIAKVQVFGEGWEMAVLGIISSTIKAACAADTTLANAMWTAFSGAAPVAFEFGPFGNTPPNIKFTGNIALSSLTFDNDTSSHAKLSLDGSTSGTVTKGNY